MTLSFRQPPGSPPEVIAQIRIEAPSEKVWAVLTDYSRHAEFVPGVEESEVVARSPGEITIRQRGSSRVLFHRFRASVTLRVREQPPHRIEFEQVEPEDFRVFRGSWELVPQGGGTLLTYRLAAVPAFFAPAPVLAAMLRRDIPKRLTAIRREAERSSG